LAIQMRLVKRLKGWCEMVGRSAARNRKRFMQSKAAGKEGARNRESGKDVGRGREVERGRDARQE
jgi:hypothetical protein